MSSHSGTANQCTLALLGERRVSLEKHNLHARIGTIIRRLAKIIKWFTRAYMFLCVQCLVYFRVEADKKLFGQNCIPVISLKPGSYYNYYYSNRAKIHGISSLWHVGD